MQEIKQIGNVDWSIDEIKDSIPQFLELYKKKPLENNQGGMLSPHMFATWFMLKKLKPKNVIESGIWKGQGTWLIENAVPEARVYSIDINLKIREFESDQVTYFEKDFSEINWSIIEDKSDTVLFFDDHQNSLKRIKLGKNLGFKHFIFEDNYPAKQGDCYSLKKAFQHAGFKRIQQSPKGIKAKIREIFNPNNLEQIEPNKQDAEYLKDTLDIYYEFPPIFKAETTRWGDAWNEQDYPTPKPIYKELESDYLKIFQEEAVYYTWICYASLK